MLCGVACHTCDPEIQAYSLLGANGLRDRAGLTEAPGSHGSHQEQVDRTGLQTADCVCLQLHAIRHCPPRVTSSLATRMRSQGCASLLSVPSHPFLCHPLTAPSAGETELQLSRHSQDFADTGCLPGSFPGLHWKLPLYLKLLS